jgi:hypothetical protein
MQTPSAILTDSGLPLNLATNADTSTTKLAGIFARGTLVFITNAGMFNAVLLSF